MNRLTKFLVDLCTGNPIVEDISPIADRNRPVPPLGAGTRSAQKDKTGPVKTKISGK